METTNLSRLLKGKININTAGKEEETKLICEQVYDLARMGQKPLTSEEMSKFIERSNLVLEMLAESEAGQPND